MDQLTIHAYDCLAEQYDQETTDFWERFPRSFIDRFAALAQGSVLDVGSGPGRDGLLLQQAGINVTCVDASHAMVHLCEHRGLHAVCGNFLALPFSDHSFDGVWAYTSLLHVPKTDLPQALREIVRVLKPQGVFGLGLIEGTTEEYRLTEKVTKPRWFSFYTEEEIRQRLCEYGFTCINMETIQPGSKRYLHFLSRLTLANLSEEAYPLSVP